MILELKILEEFEREPETNLEKTQIVLNTSWRCFEEYKTMLSKSKRVWKKYWVSLGEFSRISKNL